MTELQATRSILEDMARADPEAKFSRDVILLIHENQQLRGEVRKFRRLARAMLGEDE